MICSQSIMRRWRDYSAFSAMALGCLAFQSTSYADDANARNVRGAVNPPTLESLQNKADSSAVAVTDQPASAVLLGAQPTTRANLLSTLTPGETAAHPGHERRLDLNIAYTSNRIWDPGYKNADGTYGRNVPVYLRSYVGPQTDPSAPFVAPTIDVAPGDTVRITLHNKLPADDPSCRDETDPDIPHCFNNTNLHGHGLWVSPTGNSDNVILTIHPNVSFQYEYNIPEDHPAGTYWYHPHQHGSTALQVSSGMVGALIVHGDRKPTPSSNGDLDTLLEKDGKPMSDHVVMLQQVAYACVSNPLNPKIKYTLDPETHKPVVDWSCKPGETGVIESYDQLGPGLWGKSGRYTSINGLVQPTFGTDQSIAAGEVQRWRFIHGGVRETIKLGFRKLDLNNAVVREALSGQNLLSSEEISKQACNGPEVPYEVVAADGLTMARGQDVSDLTLQPGYRNDLLLAFPEPGMYCMTNESVTKATNVSLEPTNRSVLGFVRVVGGVSVPYAKLTQHIRDSVIRDARRNMPTDVRDQVIADLSNGFGLQKFVSHKTIATNEVTGKQELVFNIDLSNPDHLKFEVGTDGKKPRPYKPEVIDRKLVLNGVDEWLLQSTMVSHPFHIHVNPFQIVKIINPHGKDVSLPGAKDDDDPGDNQYAGLSGVWKDTLMVKSLVLPGNTKPLKGQMYKIYVRTRYERYIGEFVLHCHILDHEDQGMMQNVEIVLPDGKGGITEGMTKDMAGHHMSHMSG